MKEVEWAKNIAIILQGALSKTDSQGLCVEAGKKLIYANEIVAYDEDSAQYNVLMKPTFSFMSDLVKKVDGQE